MAIALSLLSCGSDPPVDPTVGPATLEGIAGCLGQSPPDPCLDAIFHTYLQTHTTLEALQLLRRYEGESDQIRLTCHPVAHAIGRETFLITGTVHDSFNACDQTCHSGCYHGAMERFLRGDAPGGHVTVSELQEKAASACDPNIPARLRFQCLHGLGHALLFFSGYDLHSSLSICDATGDSWSRRSCFGGVFMENIVSSTPEKRDLSPTDYHYPCNSVGEDYRGECYLMQTSRMWEMGLTPEKIFEECRKAGDHKHTCIQSLGRDLSNDARVGNARSVSTRCEQGTGEERNACTRGVVMALIDDGWNGSYAFPYCATYADPADVAFCFDASVGYLMAVYARTREDLAQECMSYVPNSAECRAAVEN